MLIILGFLVKFELTSSLFNNDLAATDGDERNSIATEERRRLKGMPPPPPLSATLAEAVMTASQRSNPAPTPLGPQ